MRAALPVLGLRDAALYAAAATAGVVIAAASLALPPLLVLGAVLLAAAVAVVGAELLILLALLAATGLFPFVDPTGSPVAGMKGYFVFFGVATGAMTAVWAARQLAGRPAWTVAPNGLLLATLALLSYVVLVMAATDPLSQPALAAPFVEFPLMAVVTYVWLSHDDALRGVRRALPFAVAIVALWALAYIAGAAGCTPCRSAVGADHFNVGLLGADSRLYTPGQNTLLALVVVAVGQALRRATPVTLGLAALGLACVAFQVSRAQYIAVLAAIAVLVAWKFWRLRAGGRLALAAVSALVVVGILATPVGERAVTAYEDVSTATGTGGYRLTLLEGITEHFSVFGAGVTPTTIDLGINVDLGIPNTIIVLGVLGAVLQVGVLVLGVLRGLQARTLAGATLAAVFVLVLVARPTLPLIEYGHSAIAYGAAVGIAAWLGLAPRSRPAPVAPPWPTPHVARS